MRRIGVALLVLGVWLAPAASRAQEVLEEPKPRTPFDQGRFSLGLALGPVDSLGDRYIVAGGAFGYYVLPGLELSVSGTKWFGDGPIIADASPKVRFIAYMVPGSIKPFVGTFFSRLFVEDPIGDIDSVGGTAGIVWLQGRGLLLSLGATVERYISDQIADEDKTQIYPSLNLSVSF